MTYEQIMYDVTKQWLNARFFYQSGNDFYVKQLQYCLTQSSFFISEV
jgi:hypothetical protein